MSSYFSLNFTGSYSSLQKFFDNQGWIYEIKQVAPNKALVKTSEESGEELTFFQNSENDFNIKYENVNIFKYSSLKFLKASS